MRMSAISIDGHSIEAEITTFTWGGLEIPEGWCQADCRSYQQGETEKVENGGLRVSYKAVHRCKALEGAEIQGVGHLCVPYARRGVSRFVTGAGRSEFLIGREKASGKSVGSA